MVGLETSITLFQSPFLYDDTQIFCIMKPGYGEILRFLTF